jgi:hypothetical protein
MADVSFLPIVDGQSLSLPVRDALNPTATLCDDGGQSHRLPRFFYEVSSWDQAMRTQLSPNFGLWEFIQTDVREAEALRGFPRYVPCAVTLLAVALERFRQTVGTFVRIAANGGYRSPAHRASSGATTHAWGAAANIYMIGDQMLDNQEAIERFAGVARSALPGAWTRPYGPGVGATTDHLHLDLGYVVVVPRLPSADSIEPDTADRA